MAVSPLQNPLLWNDWLDLVASFQGTEYGTNDGMSPPRLQKKKVSSVLTLSFLYTFKDTVELHEWREAQRRPPASKNKESRPSNQDSSQRIRLFSSQAL